MIDDPAGFPGSLELEVFSTGDLVFPYPAFVLSYCDDEISTVVHTAGRIYNDYEAARYLESGRMPNTAEAMERYYSRTANSPNDVFCAIIERETGRHIGPVKLGSIDWLHRSAAFGIMVGTKDRWGRGYGTEATTHPGLWFSPAESVQGGPRRSGRPCRRNPLLREDGISTRRDHQNHPPRIP